MMSSLMAPGISIVALGAGIKLNCSISENYSALWTYTSWIKSKETNLYLGTDILASMRSRYRIDKTISEQHNLIIDSVDLAHAGRYTCYSVMQYSLINDIQLIVLGKRKLTVLT